MPMTPPTTARPNDAVMQGECATLFVSLELSKKTWLVTSLVSDSNKMSRHTVEGGDRDGLLDLLQRLRNKAAERLQTPVAIVTIQEAGYDGFWIHRFLEQHGIESHIVDPASIAIPRRHRRAKTDRIDGEQMLRTLLAWKRGEPRVCSMVVAPTPEAEDQRRLTRERDNLLKERIRHLNRIKGLLFAQGIRDYDPDRSDRRARLEELATGDGRPLPMGLKAEILRELDRLVVAERHIAEVEAARDAFIATKEPAAGRIADDLMKLKSIGPEIASALALEAFHRHYDNRRQVAAMSGLVPSPWRSGKVAHEQGIAKSGNRKLRKTMVNLGWSWLRWQPDSRLSRWFRERVQLDNGPRNRKIAIVAMARKLLIALWRYVTTGELPEGAALKVA
jgi:transposase